MTQELILLPAFLMVLLTIFVWVYMLKMRIAGMKENRVHPEKMKSQKAKSLLPDHSSVSAENFSNIFEIPTLFYVLLGFIFMTKSISVSLLVLAFAYVVLRMLHSGITLTYNKVMHRFPTYVLSCLVLWVMWVNFAYELVAADKLF